jgi:hypothetical protein
MAIKAVPLAAIATGTLFVYSGLKGAAVTKTLAELVQGQKPDGADIYAISGNVVDSTGGPGTGVAGSATNSQFANTCASYAGKVPYVWGGSSTSGWDCSGMVNRVRSNLGLAIPGFKAGQSFSGHGPVTGQYLVWTGAKTVPRNQAQAGDLACWPTHIGVCLSNSQMVSAVDEAQGTAITTIQGPALEPLVIRRPL